MQRSGSGGPGAIGVEEANEALEDWSEQARKLTEQHRPGADGELGRFLESIERGIALRRPLDRENPASSMGAGRRTLVRLLTELRQSVEQNLDTWPLSSSDHDLLVQTVRRWLGETRLVLSKLVDGPSLDLLGRAFAIEGLRADIEWLSGLIARLDRERPHSAVATIEVELERVQKSLSPEDRPHRRLEPELGRLLARCERLSGILLERRVHGELGSATAGEGAELLLARRIRLSRLQARVDSMDRAEDVDQPARPAWLRREPEEWAEELAVRRIELADRAASELAELDLVEARRPCERAAHAAQDEISEAVAFLEDMPLPRAVKRLELAHEDLAQLTMTFRGLLTASRIEPPRSESPENDSPEPSGEDQLHDAEQQSRARQRIASLVRDLERLSRTVRGEWQEKLLALRLQRLLGRRAVRVLETIVFWLILVLAGLITAEFILVHAPWFTHTYRTWFAWADLLVCSALLAEFGMRVCLAPKRWLYFRRHFVIDFLASLPFGFASYQIAAAELESLLGGAGEAFRFFGYLRFGRLIQVLRYFRVVLPVLRFARLGLFVLRLSDRLVRQHGGLLNRNIVLFEPQHAQRPESGDRHRVTSLRSEQEHMAAQLESRLDRAERRQLADRVLADLAIRIEVLPPHALAVSIEEEQGRDNREIPVEAVVDRLIQLSPERLIDRMGPGFVTSADRYLRLLDVPLVRRLPVIRNLVAYREKSPAEAVTLAANYLGHLVQRFLEMVYFLADLQGTLSPAVFLDRLGVTIVNATRTPAKRLLWTGSAFLILFLIVNSLSALEPFRRVVDRFQQLLGWPVIVLGVICLGFWSLGAWFRKIANQSADFCERVAEAQFAAQTKILKAARRDQDAKFLAERVIDPELLLRSSDDRLPEIYRRPGGPSTTSSGGSLLENRELVFLRNIRLLYQDYLDGSPFHRSDTKASVQLLGNLALTNLRRSHLGHLLREGRALDRLDLNRAGRILGGPYLWFNYITRMIVQETAILLLDYNRHAIPQDRLACSSREDRDAFRNWLARRLRIEPEEVGLPDCLVPLVPRDHAHATPVQPRRPEAAEFLETVEFTAMDFLADDPQRDEVIRNRFGPQVAELVHRDRQQNVRRAFRSFPLHELPLAQRTINPFGFYQTHLSRGRIVFLPFFALAAMARVSAQSLRVVYRLVHDILHPRVEQEQELPPDAYWAALRKIHRMRKPVFMGSLWLRARFDVEYQGVALPTAPPGIAAQSLMEHDLDFIGATRQDRIIAEQIRREHQRRLEWISRWLHQSHWTFDELPAYLAREIPHLSNRGGEALRALVTACVLDHDDITTLGFSIEGLKRVFAHGANPTLDGKRLPPGLPDPIVNLRKLWHPVPKRKRPLSDLFGLSCFPPYDQAQRSRILTYLRRHRRAVKGWTYVVLGQGGDDPWAEMHSRMREVLLRTDLWSDQVLVLRAVQTLTMLDVQHNCDLVWNLGGYTLPDAEDGTSETEPPTAQPEPQEDREVEATV
jgi:hypothetical protein